MATPPATHPASYCPDAAHTLQWGVRPGTTTQGWILARQHDDVSSVVAALDGYPHGRTPVLAGEAREWADRILGAAQEWVEQPARSGAYHRHNSVVAAPGAALNSTPDPQTAEPDDPAAYALARHIADHPVSTIQAAFRYLNTPITIELEPAAVPPADRAGLRELIAGALYRHEWPGKQVWEQALAMDREAFLAQADAVLPVLPETARLHDEILTLRADQAKMRDLLRSENERANSAIDRETTAEEAEEEHRLALSDALGLGTGAPWDAIRERAAELAGQAVAVDRAAVLREAAGLAEDVAIKRHGQHEIEREQGALDVMTKLRRLAAEAQPCSGYETQPNRCACPCEGCRHNCAAHQAAETPGPETQGAQFPCQCGHGEAYHDFKYGGPRCRLCPESGEWTWRHAFRSAVMSQPEQVEAPSEPVHARPGPDDNGISPCCARPPFEFRGERLTRDPAKVTCIAAAVTLPGKEA